MLKINGLLDDPLNKQCGKCLGFFILKYELYQ